MVAAQYKDKRKKKRQWFYRFTRAGQLYQGHGYDTREDAQEAEVLKRRELAGLTQKTQIATDFLTVLNAYTDHCKRATSDAHLSWVLSRGRRYFQGLHKKNVTEMTPAFARKQLREWDLQASRKTVNRNLEFWKIVLNFAESEELIPFNPIRKVKGLPEEKSIPYVPPAEDVLKIRMLASPTVTQMIDMVTKTGIRKGEMLNMQWKDVDLSRRIFTVYHRKAKGGHLVPRPLAITDDLMTNFQFLKSRKRNTWLWTDEHGKRYVKMGMTLPYLCDKAGIKRFNWHALRHFASHLMLSRGASLEQVRRQLGHERSTTTDRYMRQLRGPDLETARFLEEPLKIKREGKSWEET